MDKLLVKAYAYAQAGLSGIDELEEYICKELDLPKGYLNNKYSEITEKVNQESCSNEMFQRLIYLEYVNLINELLEQ